MSKHDDKAGNGGAISDSKQAQNALDTSIRCEEKCRLWRSIPKTLSQREDALKKHYKLSFRDKAYRFLIGILLSCY